VVGERLQHLQSAPCGSRNLTAVAAAVGADQGSLDMLDSDLALLIGGGTPDGWMHTGTVRRVPMIDLPHWIDLSLTHADFVVLKLDVEGAEFGILDAMLRDGSIHKVDVLHWECHQSRAPNKAPKACISLRQRLRAKAPRLRVTEEGQLLAAKQQ